MAAESQQYSSVARLCHWAVAWIFIVLCPLGIWMAGLERGDPIRNHAYLIHRSVGLLPLCIGVFYLAWRIRHREPGVSRALSTSTRVASTVTKWTLAFLVFSYPLTGYVMSEYHGVPLDFFYVVELPLWLAEDHDRRDTWNVYHSLVLQWLLYAVLAMHVAGALKHYLFDGDRSVLHGMLK